MHVLMVQPSNTFLKYKSAITFASLECFPHFFGFFLQLNTEQKEVREYTIVALPKPELGN